MATTTFTLGSSVRYEATECMRYNGTEGVLWIKRVKCSDGSGWRYDGKLHLPLRTTRRGVVDAFGQVYRAEEINRIPAV